MPSSRIGPSKALVKRALITVTSLAFAAILSFAPSGGVARSEATTTPLLAALAYAPLDTEGIKFAFTDWAALKKMHGGELVTSASPIEDRQALLLDISHTEASPLSLGFDRTLRAGSWGFDSTDLLWEAMWDGDTVLRVREDWDPTRLLARLEELGYTRRDHRYGTSYAFERPPGEDRSAPLSVTISSDQRMLVLGCCDVGGQVLGTAARADPDVVAATPFGRVATALGRPLAASIRDGALGCLDIGTVGLHLSDDATALIESVGPLDSYQANGAGYERAGPGEPAVGRYVFAYARAAQAEADLPGRQRLIEEGESTYGLPYQEVAFKPIDSRVSSRQLILDVAPVGDRPNHVFDQLPARFGRFATCG